VIRTQLLCTFTTKHKLDDTLKMISEMYDIVFSKIYVLENVDNDREMMCTYNIKSERNNNALSNTISIHRKKMSNTLYTINALNNIVSLLNDGKLDPNFLINWENYKNSLLVTDDDGLKQIHTKIFKIIELED